MDIWQEFHGPNAGYILELYDRFLRDPSLVDPAMRAAFAAWQPPRETLPSAPVTTTAPPPNLDKVMAAVNLAQAIREYGHLAAQLDPLGSAPPGDPTLDPASHGLTDEDLQQLPASLIGGPLAAPARTAAAAIQALRQTYVGHIGYDYDHIRNPDERAWLRTAAEAGPFRPPAQPMRPLALLERLTQVEAFEQFLHRIFPGKTRFSLEGLDMLVPMLDEIVGASAEDEVRSVLMGMAHRGRLNVLAHVLNKPYAQILAEYKDPLRGAGYTIREDLGWTGDVKYHKGALRAIGEGALVNLVVSMAPNPSHLEFVNPVVEGMARAVATQAYQPGPPILDEHACLPILIHGDAAFPGQGIVAETLNFSRLAGYRTGGTIHIIANNQVGFTALRPEVCSTLYVSDLAKGFKIPIVHVNADDPEACIEVARLAYAYTARFERDFLIDLIGYRRYGHNEGDEPTFTQPLMYQAIEKHPTVRELWAGVLIDRGISSQAWADSLRQTRLDALQGVLASLKPEEDLAEQPPTPPPPGAARRTKTGVPAAHLRALNAALLETPPDFTVNPKLLKAMEKRRQVFAGARDEETLVDWATAEALALASILADGTPIRLTGEDVERGTFSHRHAVYHDVRTGARFIPLQALVQARASFEIHNSPLTEGATIGFEYGYSIQDPRRLVIWEAQYGDFINGAQVIIDEYLTSARAKFGQTPSLVLLLPHGYEGQGPDHSSARVERFLQAAAETNMRIANCTTAAQYFHLLRRQAALLETDPLPLVVLTPKSLLRHPLTASPLTALAEGHWQPVLDDTQATPQTVRRVLLCSGKVAVDLLTSKLRPAHPEVAIMRVEQLYPFPLADLGPLLEGYPALHEVVWLQEEPENMGTWAHALPRLQELLKNRWPLRYLGRPRASSPAEGSTNWHVVNQNALIEQAFQPLSDTE
jgi:2-oxoglutarate dehydrogenase E1 component